MAILYQESRFVPDARPPRTTCLWIFPGPRPSSAYGYAQAKDETWELYQNATGNTGADRDDFGDCADFVGWYCWMSMRKCGIRTHDAYRLYLAYHEGWGGYRRGTYWSKKWLLNTARRVEAQARRYRDQLAECESEFRKKGGFCLWPF